MGNQHVFKSVSFSSLKRAKNFSPKFNEKDGQVERQSQSGFYMVENGKPRYLALCVCACLVLVVSYLFISI